MRRSGHRPPLAAPIAILVALVVAVATAGTASAQAQPSKEWFCYSHFEVNPADATVGNIQQWMKTIDPTTGKPYLQTVFLPVAVPGTGSFEQNIPDSDMHLICNPTGRATGAYMGNSGSRYSQAVYNAVLSNSKLEGLSFPYGVYAVYTS